LAVLAKEILATLSQAHTYSEGESERERESELSRERDRVALYSAHTDHTTFVWNKV